MSRASGAQGPLQAFLVSPGVKASAGTTSVATRKLFYAAGALSHARKHMETRKLFCCEKTNKKPQTQVSDRRTSEPCYSRLNGAYLSPTVACRWRNEGTVPKSVLSSMKPSRPAHGAAGVERDSVRR